MPGPPALPPGLPTLATRLCWLPTGTWTGKSSGRPGTPVCQSLFPNPPPDQCQLLLWDKPLMPGRAAGWQTGHLLSSQSVKFLFCFALGILEWRLGAEGFWRQASSAPHWPDVVNDVQRGAGSCEGCAPHPGAGLGIGPDREWGVSTESLTVCSLGAPLGMDHKGVECSSIGALGFAKEAEELRVSSSTECQLSCDIAAWLSLLHVPFLVPVPHSPVSGRSHAASQAYDALPCH